MRRRSCAHSSLEPTGFTTPSPRPVRGRLPTALSLAPTRSGDVPSPRATNCEASSGFVAVRFFFLARGNVGVANALATDPRGTTEARSGERGPNPPDKRWSGNLGGGINAALRAKQCTGSPGSRGHGVQVLLLAGAISPGHVGVVLQELSALLH